MRFLTSWSSSNRFGAALVLCLSAGFMATGLAQQQPAGGQAAGKAALRIGVVDVGLLFKNYKRKDAFESQINDLRERLKKEVERDHEELRKKRMAFEELPFRSGSEPWLREREKLKLAQYSLELKQERLQSGLKNEVEQNTLRILTELETTIAEWGALKGYDLILKIDKADRSNIRGEGELVEHFQERIFRAQISDVLFFNKSQDITQTVLGHLNSDANLRRMERLK